MSFSKKHTSSIGFTLIEIIITISILLFGIVMVYGPFATIVLLTDNISSRFTASYLAQEGLEIVRNLRDNNFISKVAWTQGLASCSAGCQADYKTVTTSQLTPYNSNTFFGLNSDGFYSYDVGSTPTMFTRKITITTVSTDVINVDVLVYWTYQGKTLSAEANEYLYNWF